MITLQHEDNCSTDTPCGGKTRATGGMHLNLLAHWWRQ